MDVDIQEVPEDWFPFEAQLRRVDRPDAPPVWSTVVTGPGVLTIPGFGGSGFTVRARIILADGTVIDEDPPAD